MSGDPAEPGLPARLVLRLKVEEFLVEEAWLLDNWQLREWTALFTANGMNYVPALDDPGGSPSDTVYLVSDDMSKTRSRVEQLLGAQAWVENPRSRTRRLVGNVRIAAAGPREVVATASFVVTRSRRDRIDTWMGHTRYRLEPHGESFRIAERTVFINQDSMRPQNMISIII